MITRPRSPNVCVKKDYETEEEARAQQRTVEQLTNDIHEQQAWGWRHCWSAHAQTDKNRALSATCFWVWGSRRGGYNEYYLPDTTPCGAIEIQWRFGGTYCPHPQSPQVESTTSRDVWGYVPGAQAQTHFSILQPLLRYNSFAFVTNPIKEHKITLVVFKITKLIFYHVSLRVAIRSTTVFTNFTHFYRLDPVECITIKKVLRP
jgi:hypothetical protein